MAIGCWYLVIVMVVIHSNGPWWFEVTLELMQWQKKERKPNIRFLISPHGIANRYHGRGSLVDTQLTQSDCVRPTNNHIGDAGQQIM